MKVTAYCFLPGITFDPLPKPFKVKEGVAWIGHDWEPNTGQTEQEIRGCFLSYETQANIDDFLRREEDPNDKEHKAQFMQIGRLLDKYRGELNEVATAIEGLVSVMTIHAFPAFQIEHVNVRLTSENEAERSLIAQEKVLHTFGDVGKVSDVPLEKVSDSDSILSYVPRAEERLSALSIYTLAARAEARFELEVAYSHFFRVIEGYLGDGTRNIEAALQGRADEIIGLINPEEEFIAGLKGILQHLRLPSKAKDLNDKEGIVSDLVLLRHKLIHYNLTHQDRHFYSSLRVDLKRVCRGMHRAAFFLVRRDIAASS